MKTTPKDFFLNLGAIIALYVSAFAFLSLVFSIINAAFPPVQYGYSYFSNSISWPVATLIIVFPILVFLGWLLHRDYEAHPDKKNLGVRRWLVYITLFVSGVTIASDLVVLLYTFLNGDDITIGFVLKVLAVLVVAGAVFFYFISDLRHRLTFTGKKAYVVVSTVVILAMIVWGFALMGSPRTQRLMKLDMDRVYDLQSIQYQVVNYWQHKEMFPTSITDLNDPISGFMVPVDPSTGRSYEYRPLGGLDFEVCALFDRKSAETMNGLRDGSYAQPLKSDVTNDTWEHGAGRTCFKRTIDPKFYPPVNAIRS